MREITNEHAICQEMAESLQATINKLQATIKTLQERTNGLDPKVVTPIAKLQETINTLTDQIEVAGRMVGQVLDNYIVSGNMDLKARVPMNRYQREYLLSRAYDALGSTYFKVTRKPLEWWRDSEKTKRGFVSR